MDSLVQTFGQRAPLLIEISPSNSTPEVINELTKQENLWLALFGSGQLEFPIGILDWVRFLLTVLQIIVFTSGWLGCSRRTRVWDSMQICLQMLGDVDTLCNLFMTWHFTHDILPLTTKVYILAMAALILYGIPGSLRRLSGQLDLPWIAFLCIRPRQGSTTPIGTSGNVDLHSRPSNSTPEVISEFPKPVAEWGGVAGSRRTEFTIGILDWVRLVLTVLPIIDEEFSDWLRCNRRIFSDRVRQFLGIFLEIWSELNAFCRPFMARPLLDDNLTPSTKVYILAMVILILYDMRDRFQRLQRQLERLQKIAFPSVGSESGSTTPIGASEQILNSDNAFQADQSRHVYTNDIQGSIKYGCLHRITKYFRATRVRNWEGDDMV